VKAVVVIVEERIRAQYHISIERYWTGIETIDGKICFTPFFLKEYEEAEPLASVNWL